MSLNLLISLNILAKLCLKDLTLWIYLDFLKYRFMSTYVSLFTALSFKHNALLQSRRSSYYSSLLLLFKKNSISP
jgi:hypothetical protein